MPDRALIEGAREILATRAWYAGMDYDSVDLVETYDLATRTTYLFLRRIRYPVYDEEGQFDRWRYEDLVHAIFRQPEVRKVGPAEFRLTSFEPQVMVRCPWLAAKITDDGEVIIGN